MTKQYKMTQHEVLCNIQIIETTLQDLKDLEDRLRGYIDERYIKDFKNMIRELDIVNDDAIKLKDYIKSKKDRIIIVLE